MNKTMRWTLLGACFFCASNAMAQEGDTRETELSLELTSELQATHKGDCNFVNLLKLGASLPLSSSLTLEAASVTTCMTAKESIGNDLQTFSNLDAGNILFALIKCGIDWQIDDHHSLFAGIRNMDGDYFTSPVTSFFTNSSCGIFPTISANYPIATYPMSSVGVHYCYDSAPFRVQASLYNGAGNYRFAGRENIFRVSPKHDGVFGVAQMEYKHKGSSYFIGNSVYYDNDMSATPWLYAEQRISSCVNLMAGYSHAFSSNAFCHDFFGVGAHYQAANYSLGLFSDYARFLDSNEWATELTCRYAVSSNVELQPVTHFILTGNHWNYIFCFRVNIAI